MIIQANQPLEELRAAVYNLLRVMDGSNAGMGYDYQKVKDLMKDYRPPKYFFDLKMGDKFEIFTDDYEYVKTRVVQVGSSNFNAVCIDTGIHFFFGQDHMVK